MKSNICRIENGTADLRAIFLESERLAQSVGLSRKQSLGLRLICEEIDGMLPHIIGKFGGSLWIEFEDGVCRVNVSVKIPDLNSDKKKELIALSANGQNACAVGIVGKIRNVIEDFLLNEEKYMSGFASSAGAIHNSAEFSEYTGYSYTWRLDEYRCSVKKENHTQAWDELEKSVIASVADDVIVGVKGNQADIIIVKKFL